MIHRQRGFTLLEIMIALIVAGILAAVAIPSYRNYIVKNNRQVAARALIDISAQLESFRLKNRNYPGNLATVLGAGYGDTIYVDRLGKYSASSSATSIFEITLTDIDGTSFALQAATVGTQATEDTDCATWTLNSTGGRSATGTASNGPIRECWKN